MNCHIYVFIVSCFILISTFGKIIWLAKNEFPARNPGYEACDVAITIILLIWAAMVLAND